MKQPLSLLTAVLAAITLAAAPARAVSPQGAFDTCERGAGVIHVSGWAYDPDVSSQSIDVIVNLYTDSDCTHLYNYTTLTANVSRPDVNRAKGITGNHGFAADIPAPAGTYWVMIMGVDKTGDYNYQIGPTRSVTVAHVLPGTGTVADPYRISSVADWDAFAANVNAGINVNDCYCLYADIGPVSSTVGTQGSPFCGIFLGAGHTLTVSLSGSDTYLAPFSAIAGVEIRDLVVAGTVAGAMHCSGLVGCIVDASNLIENCKVAASISSSRTHFGGFIGHGITSTVTLRGCVFSGSLSGGTYVATFNGWSDDGASTTLADCFDASASAQPIGRGEGDVSVSNTYYLATKNFSKVERLWGEGKRGRRAYAVTEGEGVTIRFGTPTETYGTAGIALHAPGMAYGGGFYAGQGDAVRMDFTATPPTGMVLEAYVASAGTLSRIGSAWTLAMPNGPVVVNASWTAAGTHGMVRLWTGGPFWAETNVGADEPWEDGLYFWWGDTIGYRRENGAWAAGDGLSSDFSFVEANTPTYGKDNATLQGEGWITADGVLAPARDAAQAKWGGDWRMPTQQDMDGLDNNCDWTWATTNGVSGYVVRGRGDYASNSIFLPCAGFGDGTSLNHSGSRGRLGSSSVSGTVLDLDSDGHGTNVASRIYGCSVRPVQTLPAEVTIAFDANGGSVSPPSQSYTPGEAYRSLPAATRKGYVFAGWFTAAGGGTQVTTASTAPASATTLYAHWTPDGTHNKVQLWEGGPYWAETNVGADEPWDYGLYFWWGDTVGYRRRENAWVASDGASSGFSFDLGSAPTYGKHPTILLEQGWITAGGALVPAHDAAQAHWGGDWRMPTLQELEGLCENCDWTWTTTNGVSGYVVRGRRAFADASLFLPAAGRGSATSLNSAGSYGYYWSSAPLAGNSGDAKYLSFDFGNLNMADTARFYGQAIRPVWPPIDLSALSADFSAKDGDMLTGTTAFNVTVPVGATVTINGVSVTGVGGATLPAPAFAAGGEAVTTKFERGVGGKWTLSAFAELGNDALGADVTDAQVKVYAAGTVEGLESAAPMSEGVTVTDKRSAVKVSLEVETPPGDDSRFFRVGFGE